MSKNKISTGSFDFNKWLYGGWEKDVISMIAGPPGSGKTNFVMLAACSQAKKENKVILQEIYDFNFKQLELSLREIGYGDQSINKKMKDVINLFHAIISELHFWEDLSRDVRINKLSLFLIKNEKIDELVTYFENFNDDLSKKSLNLFIKSVSNN